MEVRVEDSNEEHCNGTEAKSYAQAFGTHLRFLRERVYEETTREFANRLGLSSAYLNRIELARAGELRRETVVKLATRLDMPPASLLVKAGYMPQDVPEKEAYASIAEKLALMDEGVRAIACDIIDCLLANYPRRE